MKSPAWWRSGNAGVCKTSMRGFDSRPGLNHLCPGGGIGRHERLKISWPQGRAGSIPAPGTNSQLKLSLERLAYKYLLLAARQAGSKDLYVRPGHQ